MLFIMMLAKFGGWVGLDASLQLESPTHDLRICNFSVYIEDIMPLLSCGTHLYLRGS